MFTRSEAEENLRTIRSLMERSTIYRAISAPTALVGGLASIAACALLYFKDSPSLYGNTNTYLQWFLIPWLCVLVLTLIANTYFIWRGAKQRSEPFISSGMKMALVSLLPSMICAAFFTYFLRYMPFVLPPIWMLCYGLGLLSTSHFAPHSIRLLGWMFLLSGCTATYWSFTHWPANQATSFYPSCNLLMGLTFGVYHLIYAACTWPRKSHSTTSGDEP